MEKPNIADLLKDCPRGMELNCTMYEDVYFDHVDELQIIHCYIERKLCETSITFNQYGTPNSDIKSKCVIFPKGKTTWDGFLKPFKDGNILIGGTGEPFIFKRLNNHNNCCSYCGIDSVGEFRLESDNWCFVKSIRFATEGEKQELFDAIKANGYKWDPETKTLEKLKFDITTLKPFDKVLVRQSDAGYWKPAFWGRRTATKKCPFITSYGATAQVIPFKGNEWLVGTTDDCDDFYKTW